MTDRAPALVRDWPVLFYFGEHWGVPALDGAKQVLTPVGQPCMRCDESIMSRDRGFARYLVGHDGFRLIHAECELIGILGHQWDVCSCTGYDTSTRAAARELWRRAGMPE